VIFSRRWRAGRHSVGRAAGLAPRESSTAQEPAGGAPVGPWDVDHAPPGDRVDLGSLLLPAIEGVEVRLRASEDGVIQQIECAHGHNLLQLGVFAAPRTEGLWNEVREEIRQSLLQNGVRAEEARGRWGIELFARVQGPNAPDDLRFIGVDGSRWMVRAVFQGPCAADLSQAGPLWECLTGLVVHRDEQARPPAEPLPLRLPEQLTQPQPDNRKPSPRPRRD
jgi:Protein of unknown function (DUF3710)